MLRIRRIPTHTLDKRQTVLSLNTTQKIILTLLVAVLATLPLWLGLEHARSAPSGPASPPAFTAIPEVKLVGVPAEALIGESFKFNVTFDNVGTDVGFGGFIDIVLPAQGIDNTTSNGPCDGISTNVSGIVVNVNGGPLPVTTYRSLTAPCGGAPTTVPHPFAGSGVSPVVVPAGGQLITLELPFGSVEPAQPKIEVEISVDLHNYADVGPSGKLTIFARGGFRFGTTPLNDYATDQPIVTDSGGPSYDNGVPSSSSLWAEHKDVIPTVFTVSKAYLGPEGEAVSGPNFVGYYPLRYQITVNIANMQTINNLKIDDCLENNMTLVGLVPSLTTTPNTSSLTAQCLHLSYGSVTGTGSAADVVVTYEFYITKFLAGTETPVLAPENCDKTTSTNKAVATGDWTPLDPRDSGTPIQVSASAKYILNDKRIAIQKSVKVKVQKKTLLVDKGDLPIPGDYLEYNLKFQFSDFFTFGEIKIDDLISDGQLLVQTAPATPAHLRVTDRFGTSAGDFTSASLVVEKTEDECRGVKGGTRLVFNVSQAMMSLSNFVRHNQGIMTGGQAMSLPSSVPAEGEITFYVQIQDEFSHNGDKVTKYVDKEDPMNNCVSISGRIYRNSDDKAPTPLDAVCSDDSSTSVMIKPDILRKEIIARNGNPLTTSATSPPKFAAGDTITFSISKTIPAGDWQSLTVRDWAPLPALDTSSLNLLPVIPSCGGSFPTAGNACLGLGDNVGSPLTAGVNPDNSFTFDYGTQNNLANTPRTIVIWITLTLTNKPYADGLYFTNVAQECEFNTFGVKFCQVAVARFELTEPSVKITKGVVWAGNPTTNLKAVYTPSQAVPMGVAFSGPGLLCPLRFSGTITSAKLLVNPISSDVSGVDAGDMVLYAIVVENTGSGLNGAFDVKVRDTLPAGLTLASPVCVTYGDHTLVLSSPPATLFTPLGLELTDSLTQGALAPLDATTAVNGHNLAVITFYAQIDAKIKASCYPNKAELLNYANSEGGPSFVSPAAFGGPFTDIANVCVLPKAEKCVTTTSEPHTQPDNSTTLVPPQPPKNAIGEIDRYRLQVIIPEGVSTAFYITDYLPPSMTYMNDGTTKVMFIANTPITSSVPAVANLPGLQSIGSKSTCSGPPKPLAVLPASQISVSTSGPGGAPSFSLGTLTNNDADADDEYVIVEFNALVNNLPANVSALPNKDGVTLSNLYKVFIKGAPTPAATSNIADVKILEPKLDVLKTASVTSVLPNGVIIYTIKVTNNGTTDAFDVQITDPPAAGLSSLGAGTVSSSCSTPTLNTTTGTVTVPQIPVSCSVTRRFEAKVTAQCPTGSVTNTAFATYTSLPGTGTPLGSGNATGSVTPGVSGAPNGERQYSAQDSVTVPLICTGSLAVTKTVNNLTQWTPPAINFPITVSCSPSGPNVTVSLTAGSTQTVPNIPVGSTCTVTEGALPPPIATPVCASLGWGTPAYSPAQGVTISTAGSTVAVQVQNTYQCNSGCATPPAGMVAWWPLNETSGNIVHSIVGNHDGTTQPGAIGASGPSVATAPKVGGALFFGNAKAEVPDDSALDFGTGDFSIDAWVRSSQPSLLSAIVDKLDTSTPARRGYALFVQNGKVQLVMANGVNNATFQSSNTFVANGTWRHVAVTVKRSGGSPVGQFYIDGLPAGPTFTPLAGNIDSSATLLIGSYRLSTNQCSCEVSLDEIELFNTAVPASGIQSIFQADQAGKCRATISGLKFQDLNGNGIRDLGEPGMANWTIKVTDSSGNTQTVITDSQGNYSLTVPAPASYTVSEVQQTGWTQTAPPSGTYAVTVTSGQSVISRDFGNRAVQNQCDLKIKKDVTPNPLISGQQATVTLTLQNMGTGPCHGPTFVTESMPGGLVPISASVPGGSCVVNTGVCTYPPFIPVNGIVVFTYVFKVTAQPGTTFQNCGTLKNSEDKNQINDKDCVTLLVSDVKLPDLTMQKKVQCSGPGIPPGMCKITLTITNIGPGSFNGILTFQDVVTPASPPLGFNAPTGWSCTAGAPNTFGCAAGSPASLAPGQSTTVSMLVKFPGGQFKNCASVKGYSQPPFNSSTLIQEVTSNNNQDCVPMP